MDGLKIFSNWLMCNLILIAKYFFIDFANFILEKAEAMPANAAI